MPAPIWTLADASKSLLRTSGEAAQLALDDYTAARWGPFYLHIATAVEHLCKAVLADIHPALIVELGKNFDVLLHAIGRGSRALTKDERAVVRGIEVSEARKRLRQLLGDSLRSEHWAEKVCEARNGFVHLGHAKAADDHMLGGVCDYLGSLLESIGADPKAFWGAASTTVAKHVAKWTSEVAETYRVALERAQKRLANLLANLDPAGQRAFIAARERTETSPDFASVPLECPACDNLGSLSGEPNPEWEADWDIGDGMSYVSGVYVDKIHLAASSFKCGVCGLFLDDDGLELAGVASPTLDRDGGFDGYEADSFFRDDEDY